MPTFPDTPLGTAGAVLALLLVAWIADRIEYRIILKAMQRLAATTKSTWDDRVIERRVFNWMAHTAPAVVIYLGIGPVLGVTREEIAAGSPALAFWAGMTQRVALAVLVATVTLAARSLLEAINDIYNESYPEAKSRPIKGYLQVIGIGLWIASLILIVSILFERSPLVFLSGLGALTAVLLLIFRGTLLSLVASVQIAGNDLIRIGDWVEMPQANADGNVIDIALHTVKIQNWDKTITAVPTHRFISESFKNWRGMSESGGRRIKRSINLDISSIRFLDEPEIERLSRYELLAEYMQEKKDRLAEYAITREELDPAVIPDPRRLTNVGTFRAYVLRYLKSHPGVHPDMTRLVRQLAPTPKGLPIQIYCFSNHTAWGTYERTQGDIFDHLLAILPEFGLELFQEPSGSDFSKLGGAATEMALHSE